MKKTSKKVSGQYVTPYNLAFFLSNLVLTDKTTDVLDPCCGTGTIVSACHDLKLQSGINEKDVVSTIWASDKFTFPLQLAMLSLTHPNNMGQLIKVFKNDVVDLSDIINIDFNDPNTGNIVKIKFPKFKYILSNLPFVRSENIDKVNNKIKTKINFEIKELMDNKLQLNGKSDLYTYIPFALWKI